MSVTLRRSNISNYRHSLSNLLNTIRALKKILPDIVMSHLVGKQIQDLILIGHITEHY